MIPQAAYDWLVQHSRETAHLKSMAGLLAWDQRTQIPPKGHKHRNAQRTLVARWIHERETNSEIGANLAVVEDSYLVRDGGSVAAVNVREWRRAYDRVTKIPRDLAVALAQAAAEGELVWEQTRPRNDWQTFEPYLERLVKLKLEEAQALGYSGEPYDALLDEYEPGGTAARLEPILAQLRDALVLLLTAVREVDAPPNNSCLHQFSPRPAQEDLARTAAEQLGYDFAAGRLDPTAHPFAVGLGPGDVRITTCYDEYFFSMGFFGVIHETGHALYEQGLPSEHWGTPMGKAASLGIHESQSRLWENFVARSSGFWQHFYPLAQLKLPDFRGVAPEIFIRAVNQVQPSLIRTEADEVTYNLHIFLRFELERQLLGGDLNVGDLPSAWNERMEAYLGLVPPDFSQGVMQDVHWAGGHIGYFPTYTLGNLYAAQFYARAERDLGDLQEHFARGEFAPLLTWLRQNIHRQGSRWRPQDLVRQVTGEELQARYLIEYLWKKCQEFSGVALPALPKF